MSTLRRLGFASLTLALLAAFAIQARAQVAPLVMCHLRCTNGLSSLATAATCGVCWSRCNQLCGVLCTYGNDLDQYFCTSLESGDMASGELLFGATATAPRCTALPRAPR